MPDCSVHTARVPLRVPLRATICATLKDNAVKQQIERHLELEKNHEGVKQKLYDVITGSYAFSKVPGEDIKARMELTEALKEAVAGGPGARPGEELVLGEARARPCARDERIRIRIERVYLNNTASTQTCVYKLYWT